MKKLLTLLPWLWLSLTGLAQSTETHEFWIRRKNTTENLYKVTAVRDIGQYPSTDQGYEAFKQAVSDGFVVRTTDEGCIIPIGTRAPLTKPGCSTTITVNYDQTFGVASALGSGAEYPKSGTVDGKIKEGELTWTLPSLPAPGSYTVALTYQSTTNVPTALFSVNGGAAQSLTLEASGGEIRTTTTPLTGFVAGTNTLKLTPSGYIATASVRITRVGSTTITDPGSNTGTSGTGLPFLARGVIFGNSITHHPPNADLGWLGDWGMAASAAINDMAHLMEAAFQAVNPAFQMLINHDGSYWEGNFMNGIPDNIYQAFYHDAVVAKFGDQPVQYIGIFISENIDNGNFSASQFRSEADKLIAAIPHTSDCIIEFRNSFWDGKDLSNAAIQQYCLDRGYTFVDIASIRERSDYKASSFANAGVAHHPNDAGMAAMAQLMLEPLKTVTPAGCDLSLSVNSPTLSCSATTTLTVTASGTAASNLTYSWSGPNGFTASGASVPVSPPQANGSYAYTVTASKNGCSKTATSTVTVTGCSAQTVAGSFSYQVPASQSPWSYTSTTQIGFLHIPIGAVDFMENEFLRLELRAGLGALVQVKDKVTGRWLINSPDLGRGMGPSSYTQQHYTDNASYVDGNGNHPFSSNGPAPAPGPWFTGYNPLLNGDWVGHPSTVLFHGRITIEGIEYIYVKTQQNSWSHDDNRMLPMYTEQWVSLQGKTILIKTRLTHDRTDDLTDYGPYMQEWRMMMVNGIQEAVYYNGQQPYSYAGTTRSNAIERIEADGTYIKPGRAFPVSEPWIGVTVDANRMIAHYAPDLYFPSYNHMDPQEGSDCDGCREGMYTAGHVMANLDAKGVWLFSDTWIVGTETEVRNYVYAQPRVGVPNWVFNSSTQRNFWHGNNGVHDGQLPNAATDANGWVFDMVGKADGGPANIDNTYISSPRTAFKGSDCPTLYVKAKLSNTSQTAWKVKYTYVGQEREALDSNYPNENAKRFPYSPQLASSNTPVNFSMTANGSLQTYAIPMNWNTSSYISTVEIWPNGSNMQTVPHFEILSIGCTNPN